MIVVLPYADISAQAAANKWSTALTQITAETIVDKIRGGLLTNYTTTWWCGKTLQLYIDQAPDNLNRKKLK